jgi:hypothetical protein
MQHLKIAKQKENIEPLTARPKPSAPSPKAEPFPLKSQQLLLPAHQNRVGQIRLFRDPFQGLSRSNHARIELQTFRDSVTPIFELLHPLFLVAGRPVTHQPDSLGPFRLGQQQCFL